MTAERIHLCAIGGHRPPLQEIARRAKYLSIRRAQSVDRPMKRLCLIFCIALALPAVAQTVTVKEGNIQFTDKSGQTTALTSSGRDSGPVLAPDAKWVVFVRKVDGKKIATGSDEVEPTELWQVRTDGKEA